MKKLFTVMAALGIALLAQSESKAQSASTRYIVEIQVQPNNLSGVVLPNDGWFTIVNTSSQSYAQNMHDYIEFLLKRDPDKLDDMFNIARGWHVHDVSMRTVIYYSMPAIRRF